MNIRKRLEELAEKEYQKFSASLIPNINNVLGVRVPILRKLSKEILKDHNLNSFLKQKNFKYMEEYMLKGMVIGLLKDSNKNILKHIKNFVPQIDNWAVCDSFCSSLKFTKNNKKDVWEFIQPYFRSKKEYEIRFAYVMLLNYYIEEEYIDRIIELIDNFKNENYYSKMAVAWLVSMSYIKFPDKIENYFKYSNLNAWTFNKSIQKICESLKIDKTTKERLIKLKKN